MNVLDNELLNIDETEMSSSIDKLKKSNDSSASLNKMKHSNEKIDINSFILDLENKLDNIDKVHDYQPLEIYKDNTLEKNNEKENNKITDTDNTNTFNKEIYNFLITIKEPLIIILLFILLNNNDLIILFDKIPYINILPDHLLSLILRGLILSIIIFYLRKINNF